MSELIMVGQSAQVLIDEIARLQALLKAHRDMLLRLYQDTVVPGTRYCHRCGLWAGAHDENCAMAEVEELLGLEFEEDGNEWDDE